MTTIKELKAEEFSVGQRTKINTLNDVLGLILLRIKELKAKEKQLIKGCGEKPCDEEEGIMISPNKDGVFDISQCGNNNEYCPMCSVKINGIIQSKKELRELKSRIEG